MNRVFTELNTLIKDIFLTTASLFKIMIPMIILIKVAEEFGGVAAISKTLEPLMSFLGLPSSVAIVWATTMLTNIYGGILVLIDMDITLTVAQVTILSSLLLICHALPIEGMISKKAGIPFYLTLLLRVGGGFLFAWLQNLYYQSTNSGQDAAKVLWQNKSIHYQTYYDWTLGQLENLIIIFFVISILLTLLRLLKLIKVENLIALLMMPLLKVLQVSKNAANIAVVGITLGLSYGGGLIINEARKGKLTSKDVFITLLLLNLLHGVIEDTALVLLLGAEFNMVFWARIIFSVAVVVIITHVSTVFEKIKTRMAFHSN